MGELINIRIAKVPKGTVKSGRTGGVGSTAVLRIENKDAEFAARAGHALHADDADHAVKADLAKEAERLTSGALSGLDDRFLSKRKNDSTPYDLGVRKITARQGFEAGNYLAGVSGGMFGIDKTDNQSFADVFKLWVRGKAYFETLTIIEAATLAGKQYITPGGAVKCTMVEEVKDAAGSVTAYRCWFLSEQDGEKTETKIVAGDQAISEMFNAKTGTANKVSNHRYWRLVTAVNNDAATDDAGNHYGYIDLSASDCDTGSDVPQDGDVIAHLGNRTDPTRQAAMVFSTVDPDSPSVKLLTGIDSYSLLNKAVVEYGVDKTKTPPEPFFHCYGSFYFGPRSRNTYLEFDAATGDMVFNGKFTEKCTVGDKILEEYIKSVSPPVEQEDIEGFVNNIVDPKIAGLQNQIDGVIETWFFNGVPSLSNYPASEWTTEALKIAHLGDLYYDNDTGTAYRFSEDESSTYFWNTITDDAITKALAAAKKAQDTADGKRRVFTAQPTAQQEYDQGDLWVNATYGTQYSNDLLRCVTHKDAGAAFNIAHWTLASKYTDDSALNAFIQRYETEINGYKEQLDGKIDTWYYAYDPTAANKPASDWTTPDDKAAHAGDLFYNTVTKKVFRWTGTAWESMTDPDIQNALDAASDAQDTADNKRRVFMGQPTVPYDKGDLWIETTADGKTLKVCVTGRATGSFAAADWVIADDASLNTFSATIENSLNGIRDQLDQKSETWYQSTDPSAVARPNGWLGESGAEHKGDLWYCTADIAGTDFKKGTTWYWNGSAWEKQDVPQSVFDTIDGKAEIFVSKPSAYHKNDLWFLEAAYTLSGVSYKAGTLCVATQDSTVWNAAHWIKKDRYTDDALAQTALDTYKYLKDAIGDVSTKIGGLFLTSIIRVGQHNESLTSQIVWSGLNGVHEKSNNRDISFWAGGDMVDMFNDDDTLKTATQLAGLRPAQSAIRMDGSAYFLGGNIQFKSNRTAQFGLDNSAVTIDATGHLTLGNGIDINIGGNAQGLAQSISSVTNLTNKLANLFIPYVGSTAKNWSDITDISTVTSVKVATSFWTDGFVSARGLNGNGGGSGSGTGSGKSYLSDLLDVDLGALTSGQVLAWNGSKWINSALTLQDMAGYALESWVEANYQPKGNYLTQHQSLADYMKTADANAAFVTALGTSGNYLTWTKNGTVNNITVPFATSAQVLKGVMAFSVIDDPGTHRVRLYPEIHRDIEGIFPCTNNANAILTINRHPGDYCSQLGFSSDGALYYRSFSDEAINTTKAWNKILNSYNFGTVCDTRYLRLSGGTMANTNLVANLNADLLDGKHAGVRNGQIAIFVDFPTHTQLVSLGYNDAEHQTNTEYYLQGICKWAINNYPGGGSLIGAAQPNSQGFVHLHLYNAKHSNGYPTYCSGVWYNLNGSAYTFGTTNGTWYFGSGDWSINAASATKFQTTRTLWGQPFNGTGNVSGNMTGVGSITASGLITNTGNLRLQSSASGAGGDVYAELWRGANASWKLLNSAGTLHIQSNYTSAAGSYFDCMTLAYNTGNAYIKGSVGIGTTSPAYKLDVNGSARVTSLRIGDCTISWDSANNMLKFDKGLYSEGAVSARGVNAGGSGGTASGKSYLSDLLDVQLGTLANGQALIYRNGKWVNEAIATASLTGYALESWVEANYVTLGTAQTITANKATSGNLHFVGAKRATGGKALGIYWDADSDPTATADSLGIGSLTDADSSGNVKDRYLYLGWGASPWGLNTSLAVSTSRFTYKNYKVLHEGNYASVLDTTYVRKSGYTAADVLAKVKTVDGSGSGLDADLLDGKHMDDIRKSALSFSTVYGAQEAGGYDLDTMAPDGGVVVNYGDVSYWANAPIGALYGMALHIKTTSTICGQLFADINHGSATDVTRSLWWRASGVVNATKTWGKWHRIAFTDSNVDSATKLADDTAFTAWGQTFFQTGKPKSVSGDMTGVGSISASGEIKTTSANALRMVYGSFGTIFRNDGHDSFLLLTPEDTPNGNFNNLRPLRVSNSFGHVYLAGSAFTALHNGKVGIKNQNPQYALDVNGDAHVGALIIGTEALLVYDDDTMTLNVMNASCLSMMGTIYATTGIWSDGYVSARGQNTSSDARLKDILRGFVPDVRAVASAPAAEFRWKDNGTMDVGSVAQYWQGVSPLLVTERPDGYLGLQYGKTALLSVISVARMTLDHERRIAELERENGRLRERLTELQTR